MKKFFFMSVLVLMAALTMTSCGNDDGKDEPGSSKGTTYKAGVTFAGDILDICDVTMTYKDAEGKSVSEKVTTTGWNLAVDVKKLPATVGVRCDFKLKEGVQLNKDKYDLIASMAHVVVVNGKENKDVARDFIKSSGVTKDKLASIITRYSGTCYGFNIESNGAVKTTQNISF
jgi:hypothetical protein